MIELCQKVFAASAQLMDALAADQCIQMVRNGPAQVWLADPSALQDAVFQVRRQAATDGFNFGEFGHGGFVSESGTILAVAKCRKLSAAQLP